MTLQHREMGTRLAEARSHAELSQTEVAQHLNESQTWVSKIETGRRRLDVVELRRMILLYRTDANSIVMPEYKHSEEQAPASSKHSKRPGSQIVSFPPAKVAETLGSGAKPGPTRRVRYRVPSGGKKRTGQAAGLPPARRPRKKR